MKCSKINCCHTLKQKIREKKQHFFKKWKVAGTKCHDKSGTKLSWEEKVAKVARFLCDFFDMEVHKKNILWNNLLKNEQKGVRSLANRDYTIINI